MSKKSSNIILYIIFSKHELLLFKPCKFMLGKIQFELFKVMLKNASQFSYITVFPLTVSFGNKLVFTLHSFN